MDADLGDVVAVAERGYGREAFAEDVRGGSADAFEGGGGQMNGLEHSVDCTGGDGDETIRRLPRFGGFVEDLDLLEKPAGSGAEKASALTQTRSWVRLPVWVGSISPSS